MLRGTGLGEARDPRHEIREAFMDMQIIGAGTGSLY
jgi:hypothetical protein